MTTLQTQEPTRSSAPESDGDLVASRDLELILRLIEALQHGGDRRDSAERFLRMVVHMFPDRHIVLAHGSGRRCSTIIDSQVGLVAPETPIGRQIAEHWPDFQDSAERQYWRLPMPGRYGQVAWLAMENVSPIPPRLQNILERSGEVFGEALWSRPRFGAGLTALWHDSNTRSRLGISAIVVTFLLLFPVRYRVSCEAVIEPLRQRLVAAPFDAQLDECLVRPGDEVTEDQQLAVLDGRPLRIQRESLRADLEKANKEHDVALAANHVADGQLARLERDRIQHQINLIDDRLAGLTIRSPMNGVVVSGDLRKAQGMPFETGDAMFEIAPLDEMTFEIEIPEMDVCYVAAGSDVRVRIAALGRSFEGQLERVYPQAEIRDDHNVFVGTWKIDNQEMQLRPGMEATAVVYGPIRPLIWGWTRRVYEGFLRAIGW